MKVIQSKKKALEMQKEMHNSFIEYFKCSDPLFENGRKAEDAINAFFEWRNTVWKVPGKGKTPNELWLEENEKLPEVLPFTIKSIYDTKGVGILSDERTGFLFCPNYNYIKKLFKGEFKSISNFRELVSDLVEEDIIDTYFLRKLIMENKERAVEVFSQTYQKIKTIEDIYKIMKYMKKDWDEEPLVGIIPVRA